MGKRIDEDDEKHVLASDAFLKVLEEYGDLKPSGARWTMRCPFHEDRNPSFSISFVDVLYVYRCFGCGETGNSISFLKKKENLDYVEVIKRLARKINYDLRETEKDSASSNQRRRVPPLPEKYVYTYLDAEGQPLFRMVKTITSTGKDFWSEVYAGQGEWRPGSIDRDKRPLFNLPAVLKAVDGGETVYVVEGEKDVLAFTKKYGKVATTNPNGAGQWLEHHTETLVGAEKVVIIIDRDQTGLNHGLNVFIELETRGVNVFLASPALGCNDISDHFNAGYLLKDLILMAAKELKASKKLNELDKLDPDYLQNWSEILKDAQFEEVEGVSLSDNEAIPREDEGENYSLAHSLGFFVRSPEQQEVMRSLYPDVIDKHPRAWCKWNSAEEDFLIQQLKKGVSVKELAVLLQRKRSSIEKRIRRLPSVKKSPQRSKRQKSPRNFAGFVVYADETFSRLSSSDPESMKKYPRQECIWNEAEDLYLRECLEKGHTFEDIAYSVGRKAIEVGQRVKDLNLG